MNRFKTFMLLTALTLLFILLGQRIAGRQGMIVAFIFALVSNFVSYWYSDKIVLAVYRAKPADEHLYPVLYRTLRNLSQVAGIPMPKVYVIPSPAPNAFATGRNPEHAAVACTEGILRLLNERELAGVLGHELGHVMNRDILISTVAATLAGAVMFLSRMAQWAAWGGAFGGRRSNDSRENNGAFGVVAFLLTIVLAPMAAMLIQMAVSRSREYGADETGAKTCGDPMALASALRKLEMGSKQIPLQNAGPATAHLFIVNPFTSRSLAALFSTHPPIEARIARLETMAGRGG